MISIFLLCLMSFQVGVGLKCYTCDTRDIDTLEREKRSALCDDNNFKPHRDMLTSCPETYYCAIIRPKNYESCQEENCRATKRFCSLLGDNTCAYLAEHTREDFIGLNDDCAICNSDYCNGNGSSCNIEECMDQSSTSRIVWQTVAVFGLIVVVAQTLFILSVLGLTIWQKIRPLPPLPPPQTRVVRDHMATPPPFRLRATSRPPRVSDQVLAGRQEALGWSSRLELGSTRQVLEITERAESTVSWRPSRCSEPAAVASL